MVSVHDVARYILRRRAMTAMKLQKLLYYGQACHLADHDRRLFREPIEAWANGPVVRDVYDIHRGQFGLSEWPVGDDDALNEAERRTVDRVLATYGDKDANWLSEKTHSELPWQEARKDIPDGVRSEARIDTATIKTYYTAHPPCPTS